MKELNIEGEDVLCASPHHWEEVEQGFGGELNSGSPNSKVSAQ